VAAQAADEDWEQFQLNQNVQRAGMLAIRIHRHPCLHDFNPMILELRISQGRQTHIDIFVHNLQSDTVLFPGLSNPAKLFDRLSPKEMEAIIPEMESFTRLKDQGDFWRAMVELCRLSIENSKKSDGLSGVHKAVNSDIVDLFAGKTEQELKELEVSLRCTATQLTSCFVEIHEG
jgi:hypothetical protein